MDYPKQSKLVGRVTIGCVAAVGAVLLSASPAGASPLTAEHSIVHRQAQNEEITKKYVEWGGAGSPLGAPVGDVYAVGDGYGQNYQGGAIYYSPTSGAHVMYGVILDKYRELGGPAGDIGFPKTDEVDAATGASRLNEFAAPGGATIFWTPVGGAWLVRGPILAAWNQLGGDTGPLGHPISDETVIDGEHITKFSGANGTAEVRWTEANGFVTVPAELATQLQGLAIPGMPTESAAASASASASGETSMSSDAVTTETDSDSSNAKWWWLVPIVLGIALIGGLIAWARRRRDGDVDGRGAHATTVSGPDTTTRGFTSPDVNVSKVRAPGVSGSAVAGTAGASAAGAAALGGKLTGAGKGVNAPRVTTPNADVTADVARSGGLDAGKVVGGVAAAGAGVGSLAWLTSRVGGSDAQLDAMYAGLGGVDDFDVSYQEVVSGIPATATGGARYLVDGSLSPKVAGLLRDAGYDAVHVSDAGLSDGDNARVIARAIADGRVLITSELSYVDDLITSKAGPSVLVLRRAGTTTEEQGSVLLASLPHIARALGAGALAVLGWDRIRVRALPLSRR